MKTNRTAVFLAVAAALAVAALFPLPQRQATVAIAPGAATDAPASVLPLQTAASHGSVQLTAKLGNRAVAAGEASVVFARVNLQATHFVPPARRGAIDVALVLDRSGSMAGQKLQQAKQAAATLIAQLGDGDRLTLIDYGSDVRVVGPVMMAPDSREAMKAEAARIYDNGGTNISAALEAGLKAVADRGDFTAHRVILVSDGQPTEGRTDDAGLTQLAALIREKGAAVSAIGVGLDYNDRLMRAIADSGGGFYAYLRDASQLDDIFQRELGQATQAVAQQVELRVRPATGVTVQEVYGLPSHRDADGSTVVQGYDLASDRTTSLLVQLQVPAGQTEALVGVEVRYFDVLTQRLAASELGLTAVRTDDPAALENGRDAEVFADSLRAIGGKQLAEATEQFERGNKEEGLRLFSNVRTLFGASAQALAGEIAQLDSSAQALAGDDSGVVKDEAKLVRKNLSSFGTNNAY